MGGLHPRASLYEKPVNLDAAQKAHAEFRRVMRDNGVRVVTVREILAYGVDDHMGARVELEQFAMLVRRRRRRRREICRPALGPLPPPLPGRRCSRRRRPAAQALTYRLAEGTTLEDLDAQDRYYLSDEYKRKVLEHMSVPQLIDTILINPTVNIEPSYRDTGARRCECWAAQGSGRPASLPSHDAAHQLPLAAAFWTQG